MVYRWAYDYSVPGVKADFIPQNVSPEEVEMMEEPTSGTSKIKADVKQEVVLDIFPHIKQAQPDDDKGGA